MSINPVSSYTSSGSIEPPVYNQMDYSGYKLTKQGNLYKESNSWKTYAPMIAAPWGAINAVLADSESSILSRQKKTTALKAFTVIYSAFISGLLWLGLGTLIDKAIDTSRAKRADELAELNTRSYYG